MNMLATIVPKSDQINADDLIGKTMTITVREVTFSGGSEQPVSMFFDGSDKAFRPCKSMCRVLVAAWGPDAKQYVGRSMTLYRDPDVKFGGMAVGGIRISHMTHLDGPLSMALTATKGSRKMFKVAPLATPRQDAPPTVADARNAIDAAASLEDLRGVWRTYNKLPFWPEVDREFTARRTELTLPADAAEGRDDADHGEAFTTIDAEADILAHLARKVREEDVNSLVRSRIGELDEDGQDRVRTAAMAKIAELKGVCS
jgi:hypothetical protein